MKKFCHPGYQKSAQQRFWSALTWTFPGFTSEGPLLTLPLVCFYSLNTRNIQIFIRVLVLSRAMIILIMSPNNMLLTLALLNKLKDATPTSNFQPIRLLDLDCCYKFTYLPTSNFQPIRLLDLDCCYKFTYLMANSADTDQLASSEANWSGSTLFVKIRYIQVQQDKG